MLGGVGGAAVGSLGGASGLLGKQRPSVAQSANLDKDIRRVGKEFKGKDEVTGEKTLRGLNNMSNDEVLGSFGRGAGIYGAGETGVRLIGRYGSGLGNYTSASPNAATLRSFLSKSPSALATVDNLSPDDLDDLLGKWRKVPVPGPVAPGAAPPTVMPRAITDFQAQEAKIRAALRGSDNIAAKALADVKDPRTIARALVSDGYSAKVPVEGRMKLMTPGSIFRTGRAGLVGTLIGGASKGIDIENERVTSDYFKTMTNGLGTRYGALPPLKYTPGGNPNADLGATVGPSDLTVQTRLDQIRERLTSPTKGKLTPKEVADLSGELEGIRDRMQLAEMKQQAAAEEAARKARR